MGRIEKTVFLSYRRTNLPWALAIFQNLTQHGYDVFFDYNGTGRGDFEGVILGNIIARAHFLVLLTPSALEVCGEPADWWRREIETALESQRHIVPLFLEGLEFSTWGIASQLTGTLAPVQHCHALRVPAEHFGEAMGRLRETYLSVPLETVLYPASCSAQRAATAQKAAAETAPAVAAEDLAAQYWFERGFHAGGLEEKLHFYTRAIHLQPAYAAAFINRGNARRAHGDLESALEDYNEAIRLQPDSAVAFNNRGVAHSDQGDLESALEDYNEAIRNEPDYAIAFNNRGNARRAKGYPERALQDYNQALRLQPDYADAFYNRGTVREARGDSKGALEDYNEVLRLRYKSKKK